MHCNQSEALENSVCVFVTVGTLCVLGNRYTLGMKEADCMLFVVAAFLCVATMFRQSDTDIYGVQLGLSILLHPHALKNAAQISLDA